MDLQYKKLLTEYNEKVAIEKELIQASEQKIIMMKEIHHRVKNNLSIVMSMLSLQIRYNPNPELKKIIRDIEMRIRSMALIHEHLYRTEDLERIRLNEYLRSLSTYILSTFSASHISLSLDVDAVDASLETALPVGLITNELITNAVKYAFPDARQGTIRIALHTENNHLLSLSIADDGVGLPEDFNFATQPTLGMFIIRLLVEQLNGNMTIHRNGGTSFNILFTPSKIGRPFNH